MAEIALTTAGPGKWSPYALRLRNCGTYRYAQEFYRSAQKAGSVLVRGYLLGHAIELFLKAYLLKAGLASTTLKRKPHAHDLVTLLATARSKGLNNVVRITPKTELAVEVLAKVYPETLRYFSLFHLFTSPQWVVVRSSSRWSSENSPCSPMSVSEHPTSSEPPSSTMQRWHRLVYAAA